MVARCTSILSQVTLCTVLSAAVSLYGQSVRRPIPAAKSDFPRRLLAPQEELKSFVLAPGLRTELVADGAVIREPLAIQFSPDGRLWVL